MNEHPRAPHGPVGRFEQDSNRAALLRKPGFWAAVIALLAAVTGAYVWWGRPQPVEPVPPRPADVLQLPPATSQESEVTHPLPQTQPSPGAAMKPVPPLAQSDEAIRESLGTLLGKQRVGEMFVAQDIVRHIVGTIDSLPRKTVATRLLPIKSPAGQFVTSGEGDVVYLSAANYARYTPYVRLARAIEAKQFVAVYVHFYPLFQQAYQELGYPKKHFNDRLVEVIDDLLEAPDLQEPVKLVRPKVMYQFDDPELEDLSAGQKALVRMGPENAGVIKAKLQEIRRELTTAAAEPSKN